MIFTVAVADGIADGTVTIAFRRWKTLRVDAGSVITTSAGLVRIDSITEVVAASITDDDAKAAGAPSRERLVSTFRGPDHFPVYRIAVSFVGADPRDTLSADTALDTEDVEHIDSTLKRMDSRADSPWTHRYLRLVAQRPAVRAGDLADSVGSDTPGFKLRIRKLKNLGLTLSLDVGYRISPRGQQYLELTTERIR